MGLIEEDAARAAFKKQFADLLAENERLLQGGLSLLPDGAKLPEGVPVVVRMVILAMHSKATKTFRGISIICETGLAQDATILLRSLTEVLFTLRYILKQDQKDRAERYLAFASAVQNYKLMEAYKDAGEQAKLAKEMAADIQAKFGEDWWDAALGMGRWAGPKISIRKIAREVDLDEFYEKVYGVACQATHASDTTEHVEIKEKGGFTLKITPSPERIEAVLTMANEIYRLILVAVNESLTLGRHEDILKASLYEKLKAEAEAKSAPEAAGRAED